ncbi:MAG: response regulator [Candidatus Omnitrophica bacterium]|nr:response regulator [Candidatus Omnitrophota bacterium]
MKILIAEDDTTSRIILKAMLEKLGYEVAATRDGTEAWEGLSAASGVPELAILDWMMPGMDGVTICRKLREAKRDKPIYVILLTSKSSNEDIIEGLEAGADDFIAKPYDSAVLNARIRVGCRILNFQAELREKDKLQGVLEMSGAVCHEFNQPLQSAAMSCEVVLMNAKPDDPSYKAVKRIKASMDRIGELTKKIMTISKYSKKSYVDGQEIIDIDQSA